MGLTKKERTLQIVGWLRKVHPPPLPVRVIFRPICVGKHWTQSYDGTTSRKGRTIWIIIDGRLKTYSMIETALHEWAHAMTWRHEALEKKGYHPDHGDEWALAYGRVYRHYHDQGGREESKKVRLRRRRKR